ncbi:MAG: DUF92 domain-containing protein [Anaerolineales bacterium]
MAAPFGLSLDIWTQLALGLVLGVIATLGAHRASMLTSGGALAAATVGTLTFGVGGLAPSILLLTFFVSSSLLSRQGTDRKQSLAARSAKGGRRDEWQVLANGAVPALLAVGYGLTNQDLWLVGVVGALAASNADTWATEVGILALTQPRMITNLRPVEAGTSGAISLLGSIAALAGALLIGLVGSPLVGNTALLYIAGAAGLLASLLDSLLGATVQAQYVCPNCDHVTERHPTHTCGTATVLVSGWPWLDNDQVNFAASAAGAALTIWLWSALS